MNSLNDSIKLPSKRYDLFITAFEKYVTKQQEAIRSAEGMERIYNLVRERLEAAGIENDSRIELEPSALAVAIVVNESDHISTFTALVADVGASLLKSKLHTDGKPAIGLRGLAPRVEYRFAVSDGNGGYRTVLIALLLPDQGCGGVMLRREKSFHEWSEWIVEIA